MYPVVCIQWLILMIIIIIQLSLLVDWWIVYKVMSYSLGLVSRMEIKGTFPPPPQLSSDHFKAFLHTPVTLLCTMRPLWPSNKYSEELWATSWTWRHGCGHCVHKVCSRETVTLCVNYSTSVDLASHDMRQVEAIIEAFVYVCTWEALEVSSVSGLPRLLIMTLDSFNCDFGFKSPFLNPKTPLKAWDRGLGTRLVLRPRRTCLALHNNRAPGQQVIPLLSHLLP